MGSYCRLRKLRGALRGWHGTGWTKYFYLHKNELRRHMWIWSGLAQNFIEPWARGLMYVPTKGGSCEKST
jgi:hypothetical protein